MWQDEAIAPDATATAITCNELDRIPPLFWPELYVTRAGQLYFYNGAWHRLSPDVRGSIDYKVFGPYQHWLFNKVGGYLGQWTDTTPVTWTLRNPMQEAKLTAVDLGYGSDRYVFAINRDNSLWVSLDAAATFRRTADSVDSLLIGAYSVDLEAMFSHDVIATDYGGTVERPRVYLFALFKGPYGTYIYRGTIRP